MTRKRGRRVKKLKVRKETLKDLDAGKGGNARGGGIPTPPGPIPIPYPDTTGCTVKCVTPGCLTVSTCLACVRG